MGNPNPFHLADGTALQTSRQLKQLFLCRDCEQRFGIHENYVSRICSQSDESQPALAHVDIPPDGVHEVLPTPARDLEWALLYQFGLSVTWRGDVMLGCVDLGDLYREEARSCLVGEAAHARGIHVLLFVHLQDPGRARLDRAITTPIEHRFRGCRVHKFLVCGLEFWTIVGNRAPGDLVDMCLLCSSSKWVALTPARSSSTVDALLKTIGNARVVGRT